MSLEHKTGMSFGYVFGAKSTVHFLTATKVPSRIELLLCMLKDLLRYTLIINCETTVFTMLSARSLITEFSQTPKRPLIRLKWKATRRSRKFWAAVATFVAVISHWCYCWRDSWAAWRERKKRRGSRKSAHSIGV